MNIYIYIYTHDISNLYEFINLYSIYTHDINNNNNYNNNA